MADRRGPGRRPAVRRPRDAVVDRRGQPERARDRRRHPLPRRAARRTAVVDRAGDLRGDRSRRPRGSRPNSDASATSRRAPTASSGSSATTPTGAVRRRPATTGCSGCDSHRRDESPVGGRFPHRETLPVRGTPPPPTARGRVYSHPMADLERVRRWAEALIVLHLDPAVWSFGFDNAKKRAGLCNYTAKRISVSRYLAVALRRRRDPPDPAARGRARHRGPARRARAEVGDDRDRSSGTSGAARTTARSRTSSRRGSGNAPRATSISATVNPSAP